MKHKLFTLLLAVAASVGTMFASTKIGDLYYDLDATNQTAEVTSQNSSYPYWSTTITTAIIPASVEYNSVTYSVTSIGDGAFRGCSGLTSVTIGNSVISIGERAFYGCSSLTSVTIPNSVTSIGDQAFWHCTGLTSIEIPNSVTSIGKSAINSCSGLTSIEIPNSVTSIGTGAFYGCSGLTSVIVENGNTVYDSRDNCNAIIETATNTLIQGCKNSIIPNSVTSIGDYAFSYCRGLTPITNYATEPQTINANVFTNINLSSCTLYVPAQSLAAYQAADVWKEFGNILAIEDEPAPCIIASGTCGAQGDNLTWTLSCDSVLTISGTGAMADYEYVDGGFSSAPWNDYRETISSLEFQLGVTSIGKYAFYQCRHLTTVTLPSSVISIGRNAFDGCANLISATIPNSVTTIGWYAFSACTNLSSVTIPESVTELGIWPFQHCSGLTSIDVASTNPKYSSTDGVLFYKTESSLLKYPAGKPSASYIIPDNTASISDYAFEGSTHLTSVTIPNSVTDIRSYAFRNCENLASLTIPNSVTRIGGYAFLYCTGLTSVICKAITPPTIASTAFYGVDISIPLYVPAQSVAAYQAADVWKEFGNILPIEESGEVEVLSIAEAIQIGMALDSMATSAETYTIEGYVINAGTFYAGAKYQNWYMADDLNTTSSDFQAYKCYPIDGIDTVEVRNGSKVRMTGHLQKYYDRQKALYVVEMTYTPAIILSKPQIDTITIAEALALGAELEDNASTGKQYTIRGYVSSFSPYYEQFGYQNFYIADDPNSTANTNAAGGFYVFRGIPSTGTAVNKGDLVELTCAIRKYVPASGTNINIENSEFPVSVTVLQAASDPCIVASGTCGAEGDNLTWTLTCDSVLTISGTGEMGDFADTYYVPWYNERFSIKTIIVEQGVTSIGKWSFGNCVNVSSVTLPSSISNIENWAFGGCQMESLIIPDSVLSIGNFAFYTCHTLKNLTLSSNLISIGQNAFCACENLESIEIPDKVASIGDYAFRGCSGLNSITNYASNPQSIISNVFEDVNISSCALYVPAESVSAYQAADVWKEFGNILAIEGSENPDQEETGCIDYLNLNNAVCYVNNSLPDNTLTFNDFRAVQPVDYGSDQISSRHTVHLDRTETEPRTGGIAKTIPDGEFASIRLGNWDINAEAERIEYTFEVDTARPILLIKYMPLLEAPGHNNSENPRFMIDLLINGQSLGRCSQIDINANDVLVGGNGDVKPEYAAQGWHKTPSDIAQTNGDIVWKEWSTVGINLSDPIYQGRSLTLRLTTYDCIFYGHSGYAYFTIGCSDGKLTSTESGSFTAPEGFEYRWMYKSSDQYRRPDGSVPEEYILSRDRQFEAGMLNDSLYVVDCMSLQDSTCYFTLETSLSGGSEGTDTVPCILASGTCGAQGDNLTWTLTCDSVLTINGTGAMENYSSNSNWPWYSSRESITSVVVEDGVTSLGSFAFDYLVNVTSITLPNTVTQIGWYSIGHCYKLTSITIPASVTYISGYAFSYCEKLTAFNVDQNNSYYSSVDGVLFNKDQTQIISYPIGKEGTHYTIPNTVVSIYDGAFASTKLESINMPNGIIEIGGWAFSNCTGLISMVLPDQVSYIGTYAFSYCRNLESVTIPMSVTNIANGAFIACDNLKTVTNYSTIPQRVDSACFSYFVGGYYITTSTLYVPAQSVAAYQAADVWKDFGNILPIEGELPIEPTEGEFNVLYVGQDGDSISSEAVMLHLPVAPEIAGFTFLKWQVVAGDLENGIIIQAVYQANEYTSAPEVYTNPANPAQKLIRNGNVYILTDDKIYSITGQTVR